jgi:hypothetical protein
MHPMHFNKLIATVAIVLGIAGMSTTAHAGRIWSSIGGGCVPADEDIQVNNYDTRGFGVGFKGVATGDIRLLCSVPVPSGATFRKFVMSYKDTDGMSTQARIRATLRGVPDGSNGSLAICTVDSNTSTATGNNTLTCNHFDFTLFTFVGGAAKPYWDPVNTTYQLDITVVNPSIDPTFSFMTVDHDGAIRMDCSSPYAMAQLVGLKDKYRVAFANDPDSDRHGIVTPSAGFRPCRR